MDTVQLVVPEILLEPPLTGVRAKEPVLASVYETEPEVGPLDVDQDSVYPS